MASRMFQPRQDFNSRWVRVNAVFLPNGTDPPEMGQGDVKKTYFTPVRNGVGEYQVTTKDAFLADAIVGFELQLQLGTPQLAAVVVDGANTVQNADGTYTFVFDVFDHSNAALEIDQADGDAVYIEMVMRNSSTSP